MFPTLDTRMKMSNKQPKVSAQEKNDLLMQQFLEALARVEAFKKQQKPKQ